MTESGTRLSRVFVFVVAAVLVQPWSANAQTATPNATPTPPAPACIGVSKATLSWSTQSPSTVKLVVSATNCGAPARCGHTAAGTTVTVPPLVFGVTDANGQSISGVLTDPGTNVHGCPGGVDNYRNSTERLRFIFGAATTFIGQVRVPLATPTPSGTPSVPALVPPLTFSVYDADGYAIGGTMPTCTSRQYGRFTYLKCE